MTTDDDVSTEAIAPPKPEKLRLGDVLVQQKLISEEQLKQALDMQRATGKKLGRLMIEGGFITEEALADTLARQLRAPFVNLKTFQIDGEAVRLLPESLARRFRALVLGERGDALLVAMADPLDLFAYDQLAKALDRKFRIAVVAESQLVAALGRHYRRTEEISGLAKALEKDIGDAVDFGSLDDGGGQEGAPVVRLLQSIFEDAVQVGASDIHLEPQEHDLLVRNRIDGVLQDQSAADKRIGGPLTQRLKLMASLDISEKRLPQDGRFSVRVHGRQVDVRLSTLPSQYGESVVMRLLGQGETMRRLDDIGMPKEILGRFKEILGCSSGMVLVTGPTGSGKTTTLYAALAEIDAKEHKVITVEDPVEFRLPRLTQVQVNDKIDLSFARVLRACLRQDPDVILVGEMRDSETAEIGLRAAVTGHMVLSTLHTRQAMGAPFRLIDMGVPPFMVGTSLQAVIAQRLVRTLCQSCLGPHDPTPQESAWLATVTGSDKPVARPMRGHGCTACNHSGYSGRRAVYEMLEMDADLIHATTESDPVAFTKLARARMAGKTMIHHALHLVWLGKTTLAEAMKLSGEG